MVIVTVYHFVDPNLGVEISQKRGVNRKRGEGIWNLSCLRGWQMTYLEKEGFAWGTRGWGRLCRLIVK